LKSIEIPGSVPDPAGVGSSAAHDALSDPIVGWEGENTLFPTSFSLDATFHSGQGA